jgi:hypothetical protein
MTKEEILRMAKAAGIEPVIDPIEGVFFDCYQQELERFAALVAEKEREAIYDEWHSCVMSDLEHGVKCLNEKAAQEWNKNYPAQAKMFPEWLEARGNK